MVRAGWGVPAWKRGCLVASFAESGRLSLTLTLCVCAVVSDSEVLGMLGSLGNGW